MEAVFNQLLILTKLTLEQIEAAKSKIIKILRTREITQKQEI